VTSLDTRLDRLREPRCAEVHIIGIVIAAVRAVTAGQLAENGGSRWARELGGAVLFR
jgi:hypothetical protein